MVKLISLETCSCIKLSKISYYGDINEWWHNGERQSGLGIFFGIEKFSFREEKIAPFTPFIFKLS